MKPYIPDDQKPDNDHAENAAVDKMHNRDYERRAMRRILSFLDNFGPMDAAGIMAVHVEKQKPSAIDLQVMLHHLVEMGAIEQEIDGRYLYVRDPFDDLPPVPKRAACEHEWTLRSVSLGPGKYKTITACDLCGMRRVDYD